MWVWSDELAERFPAIRSHAETDVPLVAYSVEQEMNLEDFARDILGSPAWLGDSLRREESSRSASGQ